MDTQKVSAREILDFLSDDMYDDSGGLYDKGERWLFRVWRELTRDIFREGRIVTLPISLSTNTVKLPADYIDYVAIGYRDACGNFVPLNLNLNLAPNIGVDDKREFCETCGQESLCKMFHAETETETVVIAGQNYTKKILRVIQPNGNVVEEVTSPMPFYDNGTLMGVKMRTEIVIREVLPVLECGCIAPTKENLELLCGCGCVQAFECCARYGHTYSVPENNPGSYLVFKDAGYIQMSPDHCMNSIMLKYIGDGICQGSDYFFPLEAMEALVAGVYYRSIEKKRNISPAEKFRANNEWTKQKKLILRDKMRQRMAELVNALTKSPRLTY